MNKLILMEYNIVKEFKDGIKNRILDSDLSHMYKLLFNLHNDEELKTLLERYRSEYQNNKESWFYQFHKSIRQTDYFKNFRVLKRVNKLTPEQAERREEILLKRQKNRSQYCPNDSDDEYRILNAMPETISDLNELKKLNTLYLNEDEIHNGGIFDSFLWCLISMDNKNELKSVMELTFRICPE